MLGYLIKVTEELFVFGIVLSMLFVVSAQSKNTRRMKCLVWGTAVGAAASAVIAWLMTHTALINKGRFSFYLNPVQIVLCIAFLVFHLVSVHKNVKDADSTKGGISHTLAGVFGGLFSCALVIYNLPEVLAYPDNFMNVDESIFSTEFLFKLTGFLLGFIISVVIFAAITRICGSLGKRFNSGVLLAVTHIYLVNIFGIFMQYLVTRRIVKWKPVVLFVRYVVNHSVVFILLAAVIAVIIPLAVYIGNITIKGEYSNPAEHRKLKAAARSRRRWSVCALICVLLSSFVVTAVKAYDSREVELSPAVAVKAYDGVIRLSCDELRDGELHRFSYTFDDNVTIRFIVIQKNDVAFGLGFDACEICGEAGFYQNRSGQVVCKKCDVVMNVDTIGFKGGCNPIPFEYSIENGEIVIETEALAAEKKRFV